MRSLGLVCLALAACAAPVPVGVYRMPLQTGPSTVELKTLLVRQEDADLVMLDVATAKELARGQANYDWNGALLPYDLAGGAYPIRFYLRDGVIEDAVSRPYAEVPDPPLAPKGTSVERVTLASGSVRLVLNVLKGEVFADRAHAQPELGQVANVLAILDSPSGAGLWLPSEPEKATSWHDALSTAVPPDDSKPLACAGPLVSSYRYVGEEDVTVPAGDFHALHVSEVVDSCLRRAPTAVKVFQIDRWFVKGAGPVRISYQSSDGVVRDYRLTKAAVQNGGAALWPLATNDAWTFEVRASDGSLLEPAVEAKVVSTAEVRFP